MLEPTEDKLLAIDLAVLNRPGLNVKRRKDKKPTSPTHSKKAVSSDVSSQDAAQSQSDGPPK